MEAMVQKSEATANQWFARAAEHGYVPPEDVYKPSSDAVSRPGTKRRRPRIEGGQCAQAGITCGRC